MSVHLAHITIPLEYFLQSKFYLFKRTLAASAPRTGRASCKTAAMLSQFVNLKLFLISSDIQKRQESIVPLAGSPAESHQAKELGSKVLHSHTDNVKAKLWSQDATQLNEDHRTPFCETFQIQTSFQRCKVPVTKCFAHPPFPPAIGAAATAQSSGKTTGQACSIRLYCSLKTHQTEPGPF